MAGSSGSGSLVKCDVGEKTAVLSVKSTKKDAHSARCVVSNPSLVCCCDLYSVNTLACTCLLVCLGTSKVQLFGAHVTEWTEDGQEGFLYLSSSSAFDEKTPIRGGEEG